MHPWVQPTSVDTHILRTELVIAARTLQNPSIVHSPPKTSQTYMPVTQEISDALRAHVSNNMPIRLLHLPTMRLIERSEIYKHLLPNMNDLTDKWLSDKEKETSWEDIPFVDIEQDRRQYLIAKAIQERSQYAILSHTWLVNEREVVYPDWISKQNLSGTGYDKVVNFARVAQQNHNMTLAWLDTLCINKDSTAELDESIRSMYRWYSNSAICIVILADTDSLGKVTKDRWFTRGWTLQELMAPRRVKFYNKKWKMFMPGYNDKGDKNSKDGQEGNSTENKNNLDVFGPLIEQATGITPRHLLSFDPNATRRDIPTRMSWAARRITTREEDRAYCLMGIFGVSFSIAYGEGRERAFFRLLEAILNTYRDILAILDWAGKPIGKDVHATKLLPAGPECYVLRSDETRLESGDWRDIQDYVPFSFAPKEPMTLTHLGIRIDLYCIPATVSKIENNNGSYTVFMQPGAKFCEKAIPIRVYPHNWKRFDEEEDEGFGNEFLFGIWTFERDSQDTVYIPSHVPCRAFLLESTDPYQPVEMPRIWRKVDTPETVRISPDSPWEDDWDMTKIKIRTFIL